MKDTGTTPSAEDALTRAAQAIAAADALLITAGAGMGVDSGLPDFRGTTGFWRAYPVLEKLGLRFEAVANPTWFKRDAPLAWAFYGHRMNLYRATTPHAGFGILQRWASKCRAGSFVFTSNVDGHFQRAGFDPEAITECHGSLLHVQCSAPCSRDIRGADEVSVSVDEDVFRAREPLPKCVQCGAVLRPNVLMFDDSTWIPDRTDAQWDRLSKWVESVAVGAAKLVVIEMGAGTSVPTVRNGSERLASQLGGLLVRINPTEPEVPSGHVGIQAGALETLRTLDARISSIRGESAASRGGERPGPAVG